MTETDKLLVRIGTARDAISRKTEHTSLDYMIDGVLMNCSVLLKEQEEQKRKWLQTIADTQLAISPTGYESEDELAKRGWEWNGLQIAWEIIAGEERSEHPRLVRCWDCKHRGKIEKCVVASIAAEKDYKYPIWMLDNRGEWFCADGERREVNE